LPFHQTVLFFRPFRGDPVTSRSASTSCTLGLGGPLEKLPALDANAKATGLEPAFEATISTVGVHASACFLRRKTTAKSTVSRILKQPEG
jgi:hypothetical protein